MNLFGGDDDDIFEDSGDWDDEESGTSSSLFDSEPDSEPHEPTAGSGLRPPREALDVQGFEKAEEDILKAYNDGRLPHALIFAGPEGIGKATFAFRLARFLLKHGRTADSDSGGGLFGESLPVTQPVDFTVNNDDPVFRQVASGGHPDLLTIERPFDEKKGRRQGTVPVEEIRRVTPFLRKTASLSGWRVVIIDDADTMNRNSQNAILKILEEPPPRTLLILVVHRAGALIPTIRSRCRLIAFSPLSNEHFKKLIRREQPAMTETDLKTLYGISNGSAGQALRILEQGGLEIVGQLMMTLNDWPRWNWPDIHGMADTLSRPGQEDSFRAFQDILLWMMNAMVRSHAQRAPLPPPLDNTAMESLRDHYFLADWIEICDNLKTHFDTVDHANLDKRQGVIGAFSILSARAPAAA